MQKALVYLDQNIISMIANDQLRLKAQDDISWVYSNVHFDEISRSNKPEKFLKVFEKLEALFLQEIFNDNFESTEKVTFTKRNPHDLYQFHLDSTRSADVNLNIFDIMSVWFNGGSLQEEISTVPKAWLEEINMLNFQVENYQKTTHQKFEYFIENLKNEGNDIKKLREKLGSLHGFSQILQDSERSALEEIWLQIKKANPSLSISADAFFGFEFFLEDQIKKIPIHQGIVCCCSVLDMIGFYSESKSRKVSEIPNIRSDANHLSMGSFCDAFITKDNRLFQRAKAIYAYKSIQTIPLFLETRV